jgi:hypothetical protein
MPEGLGSAAVEGGVAQGVTDRLGKVGRRVQFLFIPEDPTGAARRGGAGEAPSPLYS